MMVHFLDTMVADTTVFRSGWFVNFTCLAPILLFKHDSIELESFICVLLQAICRVFTYFARVNETRHEVAKVAGYHNHSAIVDMPRGDTLVGYVWKALCNIDVKPAKSANEVDHLDDWIWLIANVLGDSFDGPNEPFATNSTCNAFDSTWNCLPKEVLKRGKNT